MRNNNDYWTLENDCKEKFQKGGPYYIITTENLPWLLFEDDEDFKEGTNIIAISMARCRIRLLADVQMNNHMHFLMEGPRQEVEAFAKRLRKKMLAFAGRKNRTLGTWDIQIKEITELQYLRNAILYIARNPYVARRDATPLGYRWGSAKLMFNQNLVEMLPGIPFAELTQAEKRGICHSHDTDLPAEYRVHDGMILRQSYVDYERTQTFFISANQFFQWLSRRKESDVETARWLGESILLPNDDVFRIVSDWYNVKSLRSLPIETRLEAARRMKAELSSNNKQVAQVLQIPLAQIDNLFPTIL